MIKSFTDLRVWQQAHELVLLTYEFTASLPQHETLGLRSQMNRAAISITSNIAEGFSRTTKKEKIRFYQMAYGSLLELSNQYMACRDIGYLSVKNYTKIDAQIVLVAKLINATIKSLRE